MAPARYIVKTRQFSYLSGLPPYSNKRMLPKTSWRTVAQYDTEAEALEHFSGFNRGLSPVSIWFRGKKTHEKG